MPYTGETSASKLISPGIVVRLLAIALAYALAGRLGMMVASVDDYVTLIWLPAGIAVAAMVRWGLRMWPGVALGALGLELFMGSTPAFAMTVTIGKTLGPVVAVIWLEYLAMNHRLERRDDVMKFIGVGVASMTLTAAWGTMCLGMWGYVTGFENLSNVWMTWWLGDSVGVLVIGPVLLTMGRGCCRHIVGYVGEFAVWLVLAVGASAALMTSPDSTAVQIGVLFLPVPLLVWAGMRFGGTIAGAWVTAMTISSVLQTSADAGAFAGYEVPEGLFVMWGYLGTMAMVGLVITALEAEHLESETRLEKAIKLQELMVNLATGFVSVPLSQVDDAINDALGSIGRATDADRVYVFSYNGDGATITNTHEWCAGGVSREIENLQGVPVEMLPTFLTESHHRGEIVEIANVQAMDLEAQFQSLLESQGIKSLITVPMRVTGTLMGFVGIDDVRRLRVWRAEERSVLRVLAEMLAKVRERQRTEDAERQHQLQLRKIVDLIPGYLFSKDASGRFLFVNRQTSLLFGCEPEEVIGKRDEDYGASPDQAKWYRQKDLEAIENGKPVFIPEEQVKRPDGSVGWFQTVKIPYQHPGHEEPAMLGISIEVSDRRKFLEAARQGEERLRSIGDNLPDGAVYRMVQYPNGRVEIPYISAGIERILGYPAEAVMRDPGIIFNSIVKEDLPGYLEGSDRTLKNFDRFDHELRHLTRDGEIKWLHICSAPQPHAGGGMVADGVMLDVTQRKRAEEALRQSEILLRSVSDNLPDAGLIQVRRSAAGEVRILHVTRGIELIFETPMEDFLEGRTFISSLLPPEERARYLADAIQAATTGQSFLGQYQRTRRNGELQWIDCRANNRLLSDGSVMSEGVIIDVTARKLAELEAEAQREETELFFRVTPDLMCIADLNGQFLRLNQEWENVLGISIQQLEGSNFLELVHPDDLPMTLEAISHMSRGEVLLSFRNRYRAVNGTYRTLEWRSNPVSDRIYAAARDITEQLLAEQALRDGEASLRSYIENAPMGVLVIDGQARYVDANGLGLRMLGVSLAELRSLSIRDFVKDESLEEMVATLEMLKKGKHAEGEMTLHRLDGSEFRTRYHAVAIGEDRYVTFVEDITGELEAEQNRKKMEAQLRMAQKMEAVGRLAGGVAHDFNNMLQVILSYVDIIEMELEDSGKALEDLLQIRRAAQRSTELVRQLLAFSRRQTVAPRIVNLNPLIEDRATLLRRLIWTSIEMRFELAPGLWTIRIDPSQVDQVLTNLIVNARDAIQGSGVITVTTKNMDMNEAAAKDRDEFLAGEYVLLTICDTGCGMDDETLSRIFEPFFTTKGEHSGTGLGLATVYGIAKQNGGYVYASSAVGVGTCVEVYLPRVEGQSDHSVVERMRGHHKGGTETVLIVEDEESILMAAERILSSHGYKVIPVSVPQEALNIAASHDRRIDLLLTDLSMPQMNGRELQEAIHRHRPGLRTLFMSGFTADFFGSDPQEETDASFIQKPFSVDQLIKKVREVLDA